MTDPVTPLAGKVAYVTGAARGQGRSHCIRLARAGADIVAIDACAPVAEHNGYPPAAPEDLAETVSLVEGEGRKILAGEIDVRDLAGQQRIVANAVEQFGRLDIVVANAGVLNWGRLWEISPRQWQDVLDVNLTGLWNTVKAAVPPMIAAGNGGSIIAISSAAGIKAVPGCGHYCASKFGVVGLSKVAALEYAAAGSRDSGGVTVNCICPGWVETPLIEPQIEARMQGGSRDDGVRALLAEKQPSLRMTLPAEIAALAVFLCRREAHNITGAALPVDGGWTAQ